MRDRDRETKRKGETKRQRRKKKKRERERERHLLADAGHCHATGLCACYAPSLRRLRITTRLASSLQLLRHHGALATAGLARDDEDTVRTLIPLD